jgi:hypothetical protein
MMLPRTVYNSRFIDRFYPRRLQRRMASQAPTLGRYLAEVMDKKRHTNRSLAAVARVSEGAIRNLLKFGIDKTAKAPDPLTLRQVADALDIDAMRLFRLAGYLPPDPVAPSARAEYLSRAFDDLPVEKQDAVMGVLEAMVEQSPRKTAIQEMRSNPGSSLSGLDLSLPGWLRTAANQLIAHYQMTEPADVNRIEASVKVHQNEWQNLPRETQERVKALIQQKLSLNYDPTMVDEQWRL